MIDDHCIPIPKSPLQVFIPGHPMQVIAVNQNKIAAFFKDNTRSSNRIGCMHAG
jgi:hypothetical protein